MIRTMVQESEDDNITLTVASRYTEFGINHQTCSIQIRRQDTCNSFRQTSSKVLLMRESVRFAIITYNSLLSLLGTSKL